MNIDATVYIVGVVAAAVIGVLVRSLAALYGRVGKLEQTVAASSKSESMSTLWTELRKLDAELKTTREAQAALSADLRATTRTLENIHREMMRRGAGE